MHDAVLDRLLKDHSTAEGDAREAVEAEIWRRFGHEVAVMVVDMSGFSSVTAEKGIVHFLSLIRVMSSQARPVIESHGGLLIKAEADNVFAVFDTLADAIRASAALHAAFETKSLFAAAKSLGRVAQRTLNPLQLMKTGRAEDSLRQQIDVAIGLDWGEVLLVAGQDLYGHAVNGAARLGEDVAEPGEVLITPSAWASLPEAEQAGFEAQERVHGDKTVHCYLKSTG